MKTPYKQISKKFANCLSTCICTGCDFRRKELKKQTTYNKMSERLKDLKNGAKTRTARDVQNDKINKIFEQMRELNK